MTIEPFYDRNGVTLYHGDCLNILPTLEDDSIDLILTDPPYHKVKKNEAWDNQWKTDEDYLKWLDEVLAEFHRLLRHNGSLYLFASPKMAARVEVLVGERFNVLQRITWAKPPYSTKAEMFRKGDLRMFFPSSEAIIFAEHYGADGYAKGEAGYEAKCDELRGFIFEPLRAYLDGERKRAGVDKVAVNVACGFSASPGGMASRHYFSRSQWYLPTEEHYKAMQELFNCNGGEYLQQEYEDLKREYQNLWQEYDEQRKEYEALRRPFTVTADVPYTDVWTFPTVKTYKGKHPCEKSVELLSHVIQSSSRPGSVVLDPFFGSGNTGLSCVRLGRDFVGCEMLEKYCESARAKIVKEQTQLPLFGPDMGGKSID